MKRVITTVGTSVFTNYMKEEVRDELDKGEGYKAIDNIFKRLENKPISTDTNDIKKVIRKFWLDKFCPNASAEISSLLKIAENEQIEVYLVATETALSVAACELIKEYLDSELVDSKINKVFFNNDESVVQGLQVTNVERFQNEGFLNLVDYIVRIKDEHENIILNVSGGYKGLIPPLTIVSQLYEIPLFYLYEDSNNLIEIGALPIGYDWFAIEKFSILLHKTPQARQNPRVQDVVNEMIASKLVNSDNLELTILGNLLKSYLQKQSSPPLSGTMMGYFVEHKLYKYFQETFGRYNIEHSYEPVKGIGDVDLKIETESGFIPIEIKPSNVHEDGFGTWTKLLASFPKRIRNILPLQDKPLQESWMILYGEVIPDLDFLDEMSEALKEFERPFKALFLRIKPSKLNEERHIYQDFFKEDIKESMIEEIYKSNKY